MRRRRRIKIIATLGPASADRAVVASLFAAGADVFRINMSHASHDAMRERVAMIRSLEEQFGRPIGILVDLQGPKLRVGEFEAGAVLLRRGDEFALDSNPAPGSQTRVFLPHPEILSSLEPGHRVLIDDGKVMLKVVSVEKGRAVMTVEVGGRVSNKKGVSLPDTTIPTSAMTEKDREDLDAALEEDIDWIALSFVQRPEDVVEVRKVANGRALIMAKIEKPQAIARLDEIIAVSDALMVARGDLGVEMPLEQVPGLQKRITRLARRQGKPVVVATQMLESMIVAPVPTRAEVSDVATAVFEGADAIMLSAESASGQYPLEAVSTMNRIAEEVEAEEIYPSIITAQRGAPEKTGADAIAVATREVAETLGLTAICAWTASGSTGMRIARDRPCRVRRGRRP
jgi:pyruvate kinase